MTVDLRISKKIRFNDHMSLDLLAEGFNIVNRSNVAGTNAVNASYISTINFNTGVLTYNPTFGQVNAINNSTVFTPRQIQLGARFHF